MPLGRLGARNVAAESCLTFSFCVTFLLYCSGLDRARSRMTTGVEALLKTFSLKVLGGKLN